MVVKHKIALVFDFDLTLSPYYQQEEIIKYWGIDAKEFWSQCTYKVTNEEYDLEHAYIKVLREYIEKYNLNLSNEKLFQLGTKISLYEGISNKHNISIFKDLEKIISSYNKNIELECYCISGGLERMIAGALEAHNLTNYFKKVFACTVDEDSYKNIAFPKETVGHTIKTQKLYQIAKGLNKDVNDKIEEYYIPFENMIYLGDGQTDIPAFSLLNSMGGKSIAVYREIKDKNGKIDFERTQLNYEKIHSFTLKTNRVLNLLPADYSPNKPLKRTLEQYVMEICEKISSQ